MTAIPSVQYVQNGAFTLAYQVAGSDSKDLVYLLFETPTVVGNWFDPAHARFMERRGTRAEGRPRRLGDRPGGSLSTVADTPP